MLDRVDVGGCYRGFAGFDRKRSRSLRLMGVTDKRFYYLAVARPNEIGMRAKVCPCQLQSSVADAVEEGGQDQVSTKARRSGFSSREKAIGLDGRVVGR